MNIGQLFIVGFDGCRIETRDSLYASLQNNKPGGVILFDRNVDGTVQNISSPEQLADLIATLQTIAGEELFIAVDQEGGNVCRLKKSNGFPASDTAKEIGNKKNVQYTEKKAEELAATLSQAGINLNLAPVVDLDKNPDNPIIGRFGRAFSSDPEEVVKHASAWVRGHHKQGVMCCLKHFPGHGSSRRDSHLGFVDVSETWQPDELVPFQQLIEQGLADSIMSAHVINRQLDASGNPATLSQAMLHDVLRLKLKYDGVLLTDDLQMRAICDQWSLESAVEKALLAGADMLVIGNNLNREENLLPRCIAAVEKSIAAGVLTGKRIQESLTRITALKKKSLKLKAVSVQ